MQKTFLKAALSVESLFIYYVAESVSHCAKILVIIIDYLTIYQHFDSLTVSSIQDSFYNPARRYFKRLQGIISTIIHKYNGYATICQCHVSG